MRPLATLLPLALLLACQTVPGTGRTQYNFLSVGQDVALGAQAYDEALAEESVITSGPQARMVERVGARIAEAAERLYPDPARAFEWEFRLIDAPDTINAWALPGGKSAVYSGLLDVARTEDGLAIVIGHEVAHAVARHGTERLTHTATFEVLLAGTAMTLGDKTPEQKDTILRALAGVGTVGVMLPFSRAHESEADELGLMLAADAGYDPRAAIELWERMAEARGASPPEFLSTHPSEGTRITRLKAKMPHAMEIYERARAQGR